MLISTTSEQARNGCGTSPGFPVKIIIQLSMTFHFYEIGFFLA